jgi:non-heme Fe2+,alpha-ketoglutarate-dependent halogenase
MQTLAPRLTQEEIRSFHRDGFFKPIKLYEPEEIDLLWKKERLKLMDRSAAVYESDEISGNTNISNYDRHLDSDFLADHISHPEIVGRVCSIFGPDVLCWRSEFFPKYPGDEGTDWHQADTFANASGVPQIVWPQDREFGGTITVWTAFTDASIEMGCLQFIPGTHETMYYDETKHMRYDPSKINTETKEGGIIRGFFGYDYQDLKKDPNWEPDVSKAVSIELKAGEAVMFWSTLMHASHAHMGKTRKMRLGYVGRYVPTCVSVYPDTSHIEQYGGRISLEKYGAVLVAGEDRYHHNRMRDTTTRGHRFNRLTWPAAA